MRLRNIGIPYAPLVQYNPTHLRVDSLFFGVALAFVRTFQPALYAKVARRRAMLFCVGVALVAPMLHYNYARTFVWTFGYTFLYLGYGCILVAALGPDGDGARAQAAARLPAWIRAPFQLLLRVAAFIGYFSYSIYLWHYDVSLGVQRLADQGAFHALPPSTRWLVLATLYLVCGLVAGILGAVLIERPALALRDRAFPSRAAAPSA
jgi:peptidoglycan/LPS O-acetylase OafA/YrhL